MIFIPSGNQRDGRKIDGFSILWLEHEIASRSCWGQTQEPVSRKFLSCQTKTSQHKKRSVQWKPARIFQQLWMMKINSTHSLPSQLLQEILNLKLNMSKGTTRKIHFFKFFKTISNFQVWSMGSLKNILIAVISLIQHIYFISEHLSVIHLKSKIFVKVILSWCHGKELTIPKIIKKY